MLKSCLEQSWRSIPSSSTVKLSSIHTSASLLAGGRRKAQARSLKKINIARREERERIADSIRPGAILGTRPGDDTTWRNCDLAKVLIDEHTVKDAEPQIINLSGGTVSIPKHLNFGVGEVEKTMLFKHLPTLSAQTDILRDDIYANTDYVTKKLDNGEKREWQKANVFAKVLDLRNANAKGVAYENRRRIVAEFSGSENPFDTGRPEVQAALLTYKIRNIWGHLTTFKRDISNRRSLRKLVHQRAKVLKYLKGLDRDRYDLALKRLALAPESVEGEIVV